MKCQMLVLVDQVEDYCQELYYLYIYNFCDVVAGYLEFMPLLDTRNIDMICSDSHRELTTISNKL
jgi:hypothetical protein